MRLQKFLLGFILALLVVGGVSYFVGYKPAEAPSIIVSEDKATLVVNDSATTTPALPLKGVATFNELHTQNKNLVCDITSIDNSSGAFAGKLYLANNNLKGDFAVQQAGRLSSAGIFILEDMFYFWSDATEEKISFKVKSDAELINNPGPNFNIGLNESVAYDCEPRNVNNELFVLPTDVSFPEITE